MRELHQGDSIAILGYGVEGRAMLDFLLRRGYTNLTVCDQHADLGDIPSGVQRQLGGEYLRNLEGFDAVFRSPGISIFKPELRALAGVRGISGVVVSRGERTEMTSMTRYFFHHCPCPIIGVTGTKGKGTTSTLLAKMLEKRGDERRSGIVQSRVFLGGNIGVPAISFLDEMTSDDVAVLELSSFQLADMRESPHVAVVLQVTSEHLDYHTNVQEYRDSKKPIVAYQTSSDAAVMNMDYPSYREFSALAHGEVLGVSLRQKDHCGAWVDDGSVYAKLHPADEAVAVIRTSEVALLGRHNLENVMPAVVVAMRYGVPMETIREVLRTFRGLEHRLEFVGERDGVGFYNDSFSTTPEACLAACQAFEDRGEPFALIAGGSEKGSDFSLLGSALPRMRFLDRVYTMGPSGIRIGQAIRRECDMRGDGGVVPCFSIACEHVDRLADAVQKGFYALRERAMREKVTCAVVMSPAAASFNEFANYKERGKRFKELYAGLA